MAALLMRRLVLLVCLLPALLVPAVADGYVQRKDVCANALCTRDVRGTQSCWKLTARPGRPAFVRTARCFIFRAARHYGQSPSLALYIAHRESRYHWWVCNYQGSGACGLFQFEPALWSYTPYGPQLSRLHPRWASLGAMWAWRHGLYAHWRCC